MIKFKTLRKSTHMTQAEFADILKVPVSTYSKWEQGVNRPSDSQLYLMCYYLYNEGYIKTYLNDPSLSLTEMGLIMTWLRYDGEHRFIENSKKDICAFFSNYVSIEESNSIYKKLNKHYILSRKIPKLGNDDLDMSKDEYEMTLIRLIDSKGVEIIPYDGGSLRSGSFDADEYFFFVRLSDILGFEKNRIRSLLYDDCHDNFFIQNDLSINAIAVMNCLYYRYACQFPLCFGVEDLIHNYGNGFSACLDELIQQGYALNPGEGNYIFFPDHISGNKKEQFCVSEKLFKGLNEFS